MAKQVIDLTSTGLVVGGLTWSWCKKISDGTDVSTIGATLTERGSGIYVIDNPNVTEDSDFRVYVTADSTKYAVGVFSPADGDLAQKSRIEGTGYDPATDSLKQIKARIGG